MSTNTLSGLPVFGLVFIVVVVLLGLAIAAMAVGVMFKRPCLRGSCGGPELVTPRGDKISCLTCPNRRKAVAAPVTAPASPAPISTAGSSSAPKP